MSSTENVAKYTRETVTAVHHWDSPGLVSVRVTRPIGFQFLPGQFARLGLPNDDNTGEPSIWRAYSMVTHPHENALEFLSVTVPQGQFSPRLAKLVPGDALWIEKAPFGFLTLDRFEPADSLWLVATGTGLSAFLPMLDDDDTWRRFGRVILVHGARTARELAYCESLPWLPNAQNLSMFRFCHANPGLTVVRHPAESPKPLRTVNWRTSPTSR